MLVPDKIKNQSLIIWKNLNLIDFLILCFFAIISLLCSFFTNNLLAIYKIIIAIVTFAILSPLVLFNNTYQTKNYLLILIILKFLIRKKKWAKQETQNLIPYKKIKNQFLITKPLKDGLVSYITIFEVKNNNFNFKNELEMNIFNEAFEFVINKIQQNFSLVKIKKNRDFSKNKKSILEIIEKPQFKNIISNYEKDFINIEQEAKVDSLYLVLNFNSKINADFDINKYIQLFSDIDIKIKRLNNYEIYKFICDYNLYTQEINNEEAFNFKTADNYDLFKEIYYNQFEEKSNKIIINNEYVSFQTINKYHNVLKNNWFKILSNTDSDIVWHFRYVDSLLAKKMINNAIINSKTNFLSLKNEVDIKENEIKIKNYEHLAEKLAYGEQTLKESIIIFKNKSSNLDDLIQMEQNNINNAEKINCKIQKIKFTQLNLYSQSLLKNSYEDKMLQELPSNTISISNPFNNNDHNDNNNLILGKTPKNNVVIFDNFLKNYNRKNSNMVILGTSGTGKSSFAKKNLLNKIINGNKVYIIDPEGEYSKWAKKLKGQVIQFGNNNGITINPLDILTTKQDWKFDVFNHIQFLENFLKVLYPFFKYEFIKFFFSILNNFYFETQFKKTIVFEELIQIVKDNSNGLFDFELNIMENDFTKNGKYYNLYNQKTNLDLNENLVIFDIQSLLNNQNNTAIQSVFLILINYLQNKVIENIDQEASISILVDEAHLLISESNDVTINYLYSTAKRIRKYNGSLVLTTQNIADFWINNEVKNKTKAILNNSQYMFIMNLKNEEIETISEMLDKNGGLSEKEKKYLQNAKKGEGILIINDNSKFMISTHYNEQEKELCF